jgi:pimeloyl-ACP methyl ester carboxylesterase
MDLSTDTLPSILSGERREINDIRAGRISYYVDGPDRNPTPAEIEPTPVLLIHSINAAASAHEVKPLFDEMKQTRPTYAVDLPGFGHSERSDRPYPQELMVDAIDALIGEILRRTGAERVDTLAVSLSCEFLAKAALRSPESIRSLALVSPTGFGKNTSTKGSPEDNLGRTGVLRFLKRPKIGPRLYRLLSSRPSIRFFLRKTWGRKEIDTQMFETSCLMSRQPGAHWAPFYFLSGFLFSSNIPAAYNALRHPVWLCHGVRGDFSDFARAEEYADRPNWRITELDTGALPYFETDDFIDGWKRFMDDVESGGLLNPKASGKHQTSGWCDARKVFPDRLAPGT